jgi:hypothetical protein
METIFSLSFLLVAPFWGLMLLAPGWRWTQRIIGSPLIVLPAALLYIVLVVPALDNVLPLLLAPTLAGIAGLLGSEAGAAAGWIHFLAFDLFAGRWAYLDGREHRISPWLMAPILFLILMLGPLGLTVYLVVRRLRRRP